MDDSGARHRAALWLRAERAMGLNWAPAPAIGVVVEAARGANKGAKPPTVPMSPAPARPPAAPAPRPAPLVTPVMQAAPLSPSRPDITGPRLPTAEKKRLLAEMNENEVRGCVKCRLSQGRTHTVFGDGDPDAPLFFIGEGPGENEDKTGRPFVGRAGTLLDKMIAAMGLRREQVYIGNIVKCRPPGNRVPMPDEVETCTPYLVRQLEIIRPRVIVTLGLPAARYMLGNPKLSMGRIRGQWQSWRGIKLMPTYHPSYVLRTYTEQVRGMVWNDLKQVMGELGLKPPGEG